MEQQIKIIRKADELKELIEYLNKFDYVAWDTETTGVEKDSNIIGYSVCAEVNVGFYVIVKEWIPTDKKLIDLETLKLSKKFFQSLVGKSLIAHNSIFDCQMVKRNFGVDLMPYMHTDTMILSHVLNENRSNGLKERALELYGEDSVAEQLLMKESVHRNGGVLTKELYELYKADADLIALYGAKDAILTLNLFYNDVPQLYEEGLDLFFYEEESMPLLRGPTYDLNTTGLRVDPDKLQILKATLETDCAEAKEFIHREIKEHVKEKYPGTKKSNHFNINAGQQLAWLLFIKLGNEFGKLTDGGKSIAKSLGLKIPYNPKAKAEFIHAVVASKDMIWEEESFNHKKGKKTGAKKVGDPWKYLACDEPSLVKYAKKYKWVAKLLQYKKNLKLLNTYVEGIQDRMRFNIINPSFLQHGTTSGRYSSKQPNFQNLPREDKRVKSCIASRNGRIFVGADYSQLEPRVFASTSQDPSLMTCFEKGEDFYSVVGAPIYGKSGLSLFKDDPNSFAKKYPNLRDGAKVVALATPYGRTAAQQATAMGIPRDEAQDLINKYFEQYPKVELMMLESHEQVKTHGVVYNLYGRPRRLPEAKKIREIYGDLPHAELPYVARTTLNLAMNHRVQSTAASIVNRSSIRLCKLRDEYSEKDIRWKDVKMILQVHDSIILEGPESLEQEMKVLLQDCMENTVRLPGVQLVAVPFASRDLAGQK